ncbi:MAG: transporter substrate-binding domain-containing protein [Ruminococcus sp.]|nr:transporter substrate-binding domain-containing protein [Ruminococcus sp.]
MKMKKILAVLMAILMITLVFSACGKKEDAKKDQTDMEYVKAKGTMVVGITDFAPMDYQNADGDWIGFDADLAKEFAKYLGIDVQFKIIEWDYKVAEINGKTIDVVWNGMTLNDEVLAAMECTSAYLNNQQVIVVPADKADQYKTVDACKDLKFAVEAGSAAKAQAEENGFKYVEVLDQATALQEVAGGTSDAAIIDSLMAGAMIGEGTGYANLTYTVALNDEEYGIGFRKGSDLVTEFNKFYAEKVADGTVQTIAETYGVQEALIK